MKPGYESSDMNPEYNPRILFKEALKALNKRTLAILRIGYKSCP
jgi:hypothetical protein